MDIEYNTDEYYDCVVNATGKGNGTYAGQKRRRTNGDDVGPGKRRKVSSVRAVAPQRRGPPPIVPVLWISSTESHSLNESVPCPFEKIARYALFDDWRVRFKDAPGFDTANESRVEELKAPEREDEDMEDEAEDEGDGEDDEDSNDEDAEEDEEAGLDSALVIEAIKARLADSGLGGADQGKFMEAIMGMMAGGEGGDMEGMLEELTSSLLNQASEEGADSGAAQWLTQQGVSLKGNGEEDEEEEGEGNEEEEGEEEESTNKQSQVETQQSRTKDPAPRDSAGGSISEQKSEETARVDDSTTSVDKQVLKELEHAQKPQEITEPPSQSPVVEATKASLTKEKPSAKTPKEPGKPSTSKKSTRVDSSAMKEEVSDPKTTNGKGKAALQPTKASTKADKNEPVKASTQTRKRKAPTEEPTTASDRPKRQQRSFAAPTASSQSKAAEPPKRATRSTRQSKK